MTTRVVIVGGGITGLSAARALLEGARAAGVAVDVTLLEASSRLGGNVVTERRDGFTIDGGPDSWVATKPQATALAKALGLGEQLMPTIEETRRVYVAYDGALHPLPEGLVLAVPTKIMPVVKTPLFSWGAKLRMGLEPLVGRGDFSGDNDESIAHFVARRLGKEVAERLAAPMLGGIFAGDADRLSVRATFPQFIDMERKHGSLVRAMRAAKKGTPKGAKPPSAFLSIRSGMGTLIEKLASSVGGATVRTNARVKRVALAPTDGRRARYVIELESGEAIDADHVVLAAPAHATAPAISSLDEALAAEMAAIPYVSTATVFLALRRDQVKRELDAVGFIVPRSLGRPILASTWVTSKWRSRAPEGHVLIRCFFGGAWGEEILANDDEALVRLARSELRDLMDLDAEPLFTRVFRFVRSNPQPVVGHVARLGRIRKRLEGHPGLYVAGGGYDGIGLPDCVRQGEQAAGAIVERIAGAR